MITIKLIFIVLLVSRVNSVKFASIKPLNGRIVGGDKIDISEAPHQISLYYGSYGHICGGSIIDKKWILTAGHCTYGSSASDLRVLTGTSNNVNGGTFHNVVRIIQHEEFQSYNVDYDFSLLEIEDELIWNSTQQPIKLPAANQDLPDGSLCIVTGWGDTYDPDQSANDLHAVKVPIVNQEKCNKSYFDYGGVTARMLCAGYDEGGKDSCQGDSGGPLVHNGTLFGIVSWGLGCARENYPGVYGRVTSARNWIKEKVGI